MILRTSTVLAALFVLAGTAAAAAPKLDGTYTLVSHEFCQYIEGSQTDRGFVGLGMLNAVFANAAAGNTLTVSGTTLGGGLFPRSANIQSAAKNGKMPFKITGTANPYTLTLGTAADAKSYSIHLSQVDTAGVARNAVFLASDTNSANKTICHRSSALQRR